MEMLDKKNAAACSRGNSNNAAAETHLYVSTRPWQDSGVRLCVCESCASVWVCVKFYDNTQQFRNECTLLSGRDC